MSVQEEQIHSRLSGDLLDILRCLNCRLPLRRQNEDYVCPSCARLYPSENGVIRCVGLQSYADSFGFQWQRYARTQLDDASSRISEQDFRTRTGFRPEDLRDKLILDVGCGMGRFAEVA